ncbi:MAG TPA: TonB-dependent receptor [Caulobacteraceae bacterium]|nr:TonB-dependent receptor [Caulobacteraceae bacterium]
MHKRSAAALFCGISAIALATSALAQTTNAAGEVESVVVTATRIQTNGYTAPTPVTVAPVAQLMQTTPSNIPDALNKLPQFAGSGQNTSNGNGPSSGAITTFTGNFLNLRNMGVIRTLILLDGRRVPPTALNGTVDTNSLPEALVQRVDVVTGGASAVYGSDAVTGVVNYILDTHYTGLKMLAQKGISDYGDAPSLKVGVTFGSKVFDRGHFVFSAEHYQYAGVKDLSARPYTAGMPTLSGTGTAANPYTISTNVRIATSSFGGLVRTGPFAGQQFVGTGVLAPFNPGTPTATTGINQGGDGAYLAGTELVFPLRTDKVFGRFEYDFADNVTGFWQINFSESGAANYHRGGTGPSALAIFSGNPYLPANAQAALTAGNVASFVMNRQSADLGLMSTANQFVNALNFTAGFKGKLFDRFNWETYYTHGDARLRARRDDNINNVKFLAALDAVRDPATNNIVCRVTLTNPGLYPGCAPINMFGVGNQSAASLAYIFSSTNFQVLNKMDDYAGSISGDVLNAWAGPLSASLNFEYRKQSYGQTTNNDPTIPFSLANYPGVRLGTGGTAPTSLYSSDSQGPQNGHQSVWEFGGEAALPLLKDFTAVKRLDLTGAARYTNYSTSGVVWSWKVGLNYEPFDDLRIRYTESRDIRAPSLNDLYASSAQGGVALADPHTGLNGNVTLLSGGNRNLVPEIARTTTIGAVYRPSWFPRFQMSVDYFNIDMQNAISTITGNQTATLAECEASGGTSPLCALIVRPLPFSDHSAANYPTTVFTTLLNVSSQFTHGVDVEASYRLNFADFAPAIPGALDFRLLYTYQPVLKSRVTPSSPVINAAGTSTPPGGGLAKHRATLLLGYTAGPFSLNWQTRYSSPVIQNSSPFLVYANPNLPSYMISDANVAYRFKVAGHDLQASVAVSNLFNKTPRPSPSTAFTASPGQNPAAVPGDDLVGRYYTFTLRAQY